MSVLSEWPTASDDAPSCAASFGDLRLDQVFEAVADYGDERELITDVLRRRVRDAAAVRYRQEVFADLEGEPLASCAEAFSVQFRQVTAQLRQMSTTDCGQA